jgi:hypothetical protein
MSANSFTLEIPIGCCYTAYTIGLMSVDQHIQIGIQQVSRSFQLRGGFIKQNENFEISQKLNGRSEKFNNQ